MDVLADDDAGGAVACELWVVGITERLVEPEGSWQIRNRQCDEDFGAHGLGLENRHHETQMRFKVTTNELPTGGQTGHIFPQKFNRSAESSRKLTIRMLWRLPAA